jgi:hypothetical protein
MIIKRQYRGRKPFQRASSFQEEVIHEFFAFAFAFVSTILPCLWSEDQKRPWEIRVLTIGGFTTHCYLPVPGVLPKFNVSGLLRKRLRMIRIVLPERIHHLSNSPRHPSSSCGIGKIPEAQRIYQNLIDGDIGGGNPIKNICSLAFH